MKEADPEKNTNTMIKSMGVWLDNFLSDDGYVDQTSAVGDTTTVATLTQAERQAGQRAFDANMARELNNLSLKERERKFEEIHGVAEVVEEDPAEMKRLLTNLQDEINRIDLKPQYNKAMQLNPAYVQDPKFGLMFLRASRFDPKKAADRLVWFLEKKVEHFGAQTLCRNLRLSDLTQDDLETLKAGSYQILPNRDRSGRVLFLETFSFGPKLYKTVRSHYRVWWFQLICAAEDEYTQKVGAASIHWYMGEFNPDPDVDNQLRQEVFKSINWLPLRPYTSIHVCIDTSPISGLLARVLTATSPKDLRYNIRVHKGTQTELMYQLMTFGIPTQSLPIASDGTMKNTNQRKWVARRMMKETSIQRTGFFNKIDFPTNQDVLFGKGSPVQQHVGKQKYLCLIESMLDDYVRGTKDRKYCMTLELLQIVKANGRFLKKDGDDWWVEVSDKEARVKVGKAFTAQAFLRKSREQSEAHPSQFDSVKRRCVQPKTTSLFYCLSQSPAPKLHYPFLNGS